MPKNTWASSQTAGRSNKQWTWDGERGSVHFSIRLFPPEKQMQLILKINVKWYNTMY